MLDCDWLAWNWIVVVFAPFDAPDWLGPSKAFVETTSAIYGRHARRLAQYFGALHQLSRIATGKVLRDLLLLLRRQVFGQTSQ